MKLKKADATSTRPRATATSTKLNNKIPCGFAGDYCFCYFTALGVQFLKNCKTLSLL